MANSVGYIYCTVCAVLQNQCLVLIQEVEGLCSKAEWVWMFECWMD